MRIEAPVEEPIPIRFRVRIEVAPDVLGHGAAPQVHAIGGIGTLNRIPQLRDQFHIRKVTRDPLRRMGLRQVGIGLLADDGGRTGVGELRPVPIAPPVVFPGELMQFRFRHEYARIFRARHLKPGGRTLGGPDDKKIHFGLRLHQHCAYS